MKAAEHLPRCDAAELLNRPMSGSVLAQSPMSSRFIVVGGTLAKRPESTAHATSHSQCRSAGSMPADPHRFRFSARFAASRRWGRRPAPWERHHVAGELEDPVRYAGSVRRQSVELTGAAVGAVAVDDAGMAGSVHRENGSGIGLAGPGRGPFLGACVCQEGHIIFVFVFRATSVGEGI